MRLFLLLNALICCSLVLCPAIGCSQVESPVAATINQTSKQHPSEKPDEKLESTENTKATKLAKATFGGGCFWCTEAVFLQLEGVESVKSAYMGGHVENPTYKQVCNGTTGHAEVIHIEYDPEKISFDVLLQVFWKTHDPTTLNRQGNDVGTQYRSVVFYHSEEQKQKATDYKQKFNEANAYPNPVVTEISPASTLYLAEDYHQDYFANNPNQSYCRLLIPPKLEKLRQVFGDHLKK
jgi:peptide-methionine (S)-S-oxide reductase